MPMKLGDLGEGELDKALDELIQSGPMTVSFSKRQMIHDLRLIDESGTPESKRYVRQFKSEAKQVADTLRPVGEVA